MINHLKSEFLKQKHRFTLKLLWLGPIVTIMLVLFLMSGTFFLEASFNWWYTIILPGTISMIVSFAISAEKKHNHHGLFSVCANKKKLWVAQLIVNTVFLFATNIFFFIVVLATGAVFNIEIPCASSFTATLMLFITFAWQIPLFMLISEQFGSFVAIIISLFCNMGFGIFFAATKLWYIPFSIPARLMCPVIKVLPNGLPVPSESSFSDPSVIIPGLFITVPLYFALSILTAIWFDHREVK